MHSRSESSVFDVEAQREHVWRELWPLAAQALHYYCAVYVCMIAFKIMQGMYVFVQRCRIGQLAEVTHWRYITYIEQVFPTATHHVHWE
jgi:hypothetical protein